MIAIALIGTIILLLIFTWMGIKFRKITTSSDFLLMGRRMPFWLYLGAFIGGMVGGSGIMGNTGLGLSNGMSSFWFMSPAYFFGLIMALFFIRKISLFGKKTGAFTLADFVAARYGRSAQIPAFILTYMRPGFITGLQFVALAVLLQVLFKIPMNLGILIGAVIVLIFTITGGQYSALSVQLLQALFQSFALLAILYVTVSFLGGFSEASQLVYSEMPKEFVNFLHIKPGLLTIYLISMGLFYLIDPWLYQWAYMAKDEKIASNVMIIGFGVPAFSIITFLLGMYIASAHAANLLIIPEGMHPQNVYLWFVTNKTSPLLGGLIIIGLLMTILSCASSFVLGGATLITNDLYIKFINRDATEVQKLRASRAGVLITIVFGAICALWLPILVPLWLLGQALGTSGLIAPVLGAWFWKRSTAKAALSSMIIGLAAAIAWAILAWIKIGSPGALYHHLHAAHVGVITSIPLMIVISLLTKPDCSTEMVKATSFRELSLKEEKRISKEPYINWIGEKKRHLWPIWYTIAISFILFLVSLFISPIYPVVKWLVYYALISGGFILVLFTLLGGRDILNEIKFFNKNRASQK